MPTGQHKCCKAHTPGSWRMFGNCKAAPLQWGSQIPVAYFVQNKQEELVKYGVVKHLTTKQQRGGR